MFTPAKIHFWRTKDKAEVNFIIDLGKELIPVEVKYKTLKSPTIPRSFRNFINKYDPEQGWVISLDFKGSMRVNNTDVRFFPFWEFMDKCPNSINEFLRAL